MLRIRIDSNNNCHAKNTISFKSQSEIHYSLFHYSLIIFFEIKQDYHLMCFNDDAEITTTGTTTSTTGSTVWSPLRFKPYIVYCNLLWIKGFDTNLTLQFRLVVHGPQRRHQLMTTTTILQWESRQQTRPGLQGIKRVKLVISMIGRISDSK